MLPTRLAGCLLLILVGYHHINEPLGFSAAGSVAAGIFALCLMSVYRGYRAEYRNWIGWCMIVSGCLMLGNLSTIGLIMIVPLALIGAGFWLADLSPGRPHSYAEGGGMIGSGCDVDGGE